MRFDEMYTKSSPHLAEEICFPTDDPECVMRGPVLCEHQCKDAMVQNIKTACVEGAGKASTTSFFHHTRGTLATYYLSLKARHRAQ